MAGREGLSEGKDAVPLQGKGSSPGSGGSVCRGERVGSRGRGDWGTCFPPSSALEVANTDSGYVGLPQEHRVLLVFCIQFYVLGLVSCGHHGGKGTKKLCRPKPSLSTGLQTAVHLPWVIT